MYFFRNNLIRLFCLLLIAGCTAEEPLPQTSQDEHPGKAVPISFSLSEGSLTRTETRGSLTGGETVRVLVYRAGSTNAADLVGENTYLVDPASPGLLKSCTVDATGMVTGLGEELFLLPGKYYDIHAFSPALPTTNHLVVPNVKHGIDLLASKSTMLLDKYTSPNKPITLSPLKHQCAMMDFTVQADPTDPSVLELSAESITLKYMSHSPGSYTLNSVVGATANGLLLDDDVRIEAFNRISDTQFSASQVVLPKAAGNFNLELAVLINGTKYNLTASVANLALQANTKYNWVVTCKRQGVTLSFTVQSWQRTSLGFVAGIPTPLQEPANCFMVVPGGGISFAAVRADGSPLGGNVETAEVLWLTRDRSNGPVIESPAHVMWDGSSQRIRVYTNGKATNGGKATVVARDARGSELYRWLIWVTPYVISPALMSGELKSANQKITTGMSPSGAAVHTYDEVFLKVNGGQAVIMDRNLGALNEQDVGSYYQHGSRIAFEDMSATPLFKADGTTPYYQAIQPAAPPASGWVPVSISGTTATGVKSVEDPCPYGWRVPVCYGPPAATWNGFTTTTFTARGSGRLYNGYAYYPTGCWGTGRIGINGYALKFDASSVMRNGTQFAADLLQVRCVLDAVTFGMGAPQMSPVNITGLSATAATFNSRMTTTGGATIEERGFFYSNNSFSNGMGTKLKSMEELASAGFTAGISGLTSGHTYYVQAYIVTAGSGTFYTPLAQFIPTGLPKVTTTSASSSTATTATAAGSVTDNGGDAVVKRGVVYSTVSNFDPQSQGTQVEAAGIGIGSYSITLTGLQPGTNYYVRAYATNKNATVYGVQRNFTTMGVATLSAPMVSSVGGTIATFGATLTGPLPSPGVTSWGFEWSDNADFPPAEVTSMAVPASSYTPSKAFILNATTLKYNTVYYVRAYAINLAGTGYSSVVRFTTLEPPTVVTLPVTGATYIGKDGRVPAVFNAEVRALGSTYISSCGFEYSTTAGFKGGEGTRILAGGGAVGKFATPTNLMKNDQTYYVRAYATNSAGTTYGDIHQVRLNYVAPTFAGVSLQIKERKINGLPAEMSGAPQEGNARPLAQGYAYKEEGTSGYIYNDMGNPRLKVYTKYTVYAYVRNAIGEYYSPITASATTYKNYYTYNNREYVIDYQSGERSEAWTTGFMSLFKLTMIGLPNSGDGFMNTWWLVDNEDWSIHPKAAKFCWNKPLANKGESQFLRNSDRWFLGSEPLLDDFYDDIVKKHPDDYDPRVMIDKEKSYWTSTEFSSMTSEVSYWSNPLNQFIYGTIGKNEKRTVRCIRYRVPGDEYAD